MVVMLEGKLWKLEMGVQYFQHLQKENPGYRVRIKHLTPSMHAEERKVSVGELELSIRGEHALVKR